MTNAYSALIDRIYTLAAQIPGEWVEKLAFAVMAVGDQDWNRLQSQALNSIPHTAARHQAGELLQFWQQEAPRVGNDTFALALLTASEAYRRQQLDQNIELVWTGPASEIISMRRTDQALLQIIRAAQSRLFIVSFAVYRIKKIVEALSEAAERGVAISILVESPDESEGRMAYDAIQAFGPIIRSQARFYVWPRNQRLETHDGKQGSLHAKVAIADGQQLFISSANLTEYAMQLNMELGVHITGGLLPEQVQRHFDILLQKGVIRRLAISP